MSKNSIFFSALLIFSIINCSCGKSLIENGSDSGYATGKVIDTKGNPLAGVEVAIENTLLGNNASANGVTDNNGLYKIKLSNVGSFHASAYFTKEFNGKQYRLELNCSSNDAFGNEGAVRNFQWKLTGSKPITLDGFYGATLELYNEPGYYVNEDDIILTLTPIGALIDGSIGSTIIKSPVVASYAFVYDIPLGRYKVSATYNGAPLRLKKLDSSETYSTTTTVDFEQIISSGTPFARLSYN